MNDQQFIASVVSAVASVVGTRIVPLHEPSFRGNEWSYVKECIDTGWVSSVGKFVDRFEQDIASITGAKHAVAVANGTAGLQVALIVSGVHPGDEVLVPAMSFIATANAVSHAGATPHFVDVDESTLGMCVRSLEQRLSEVALRQKNGPTINATTGRRISALVPMHTFGHPVDIDGLKTLARDWNIALIEDAAESLGSYWRGQHTGTFGTCGVISFNGNKVVTTGGGGAIITNDSDLAKRAKHLTTTAKVPHRWEFVHDAIGFNYRMPNINAALGCAQLEQLDDFITLKRDLTQLYAKALQGIPDIQLYQERDGTKSNYWLQTLVLSPHRRHLRDNLLEALNTEGYMSRPVWELLSNLEIYEKAPCASLPIADMLSQCIVNIPSSPGLSRHA